MRNKQNRNGAAAAPVLALALTAALLAAGLSACAGGAGSSTTAPAATSAGAADQQAASAQQTDAQKESDTQKETDTQDAAGTQTETATAQETSAGAEAQQGELLETDYFSILIPEDLDGLYDVSVTPAAVSVYEKNAHEMGAGFVFNVAAYSDPADYANNPHYSRGGMVTDLGNQSYDIVIEYPTDVQMDLDHREEYTKLAEAVPGILETLQPAKNYKYTKQEDIDTTGIYTGVLDELYRLMKEKAGVEKMAGNQAFSTTFGLMAENTEKPLEKAAYCFEDITGDGYAELLLGCVDGDEIYDLYAPVDGKAVHVFEGTERACYYLTDQMETVLYRGSGGAKYGVNTIYSLPAQSADMVSQISLIYDGEKDEKNPWFIDYGGDMTLEPVTEEKWNEMLGRFGEIRKIGWIPLKDWKK